MADTPVELSVPVADFGKTSGVHHLHCYHWQPAAPSSALPVLCVHGLSRNGRDFDYLARALSATRDVFAVDMPGRGKSDYLSDPLAYSYPAYISDIASLLQQRGITRLDWVGTSMGGIIAMMFAASFPGMINRLVLNDIGCVVSAEGLKRILSNAGASSEFDTLEAAQDEFRKRCATFGIRDEAHWRHLYVHSIYRDAEGKFRYCYDPGILGAFMDADDIKDIDLWALWQPLEAIPLLVVRGAQSDILSAQTAQEMQQRHSNLTLHEVPDAGHVPSLMPDDQVAIVMQWLNG